ncbi:MAG: antitoxin [Tsuneonella sp.]
MAKPVNTKAFKSGNSVAVRLPKGFAIKSGDEVELQQQGDVVTMRLKRDPQQEKERLRKLLDALEALGPPIEVEKRVPIEFPNRPGLY